MEASSPRPWPRGARAAISLTYDDNAPTHLDHAVPDLEATGFRGTFYLITGTDAQRARRAEWQAAFLRGHEMGNHTVTHPCRGHAGTPGALWDYTPARIHDEVVQADDWIQENIGPDADRSFAYPCGNKTIGPDDAQDADAYTTAVRARHYAARSAGETEPNTPAGFLADPLRVGAICLDDRTPEAAARLVEYCERAAAMGGWGVLVFHGVGGDWLPTSRETHGRVLAHLAENPGHYWVAPFRDVARHLAGR